jgi:hypothetical protein
MLRHEPSMSATQTKPRSDFNLKLIAFPLISISSILSIADLELTATIGSVLYDSHRTITSQMMDTYLGHTRTTPCTIVATYHEGEA